jgi:hypothetical protein
MSDGGVAWTGRYQVLELNKRGQFIDPYRDSQPVPWHDLPHFLRQAVVVPPDVTDVFVWVHGWRNNDALRASALADRVFGGVERLYHHQPDLYPELTRFKGAHILVRWPSWSAPTFHGYAAIRNRAHQMTEQGHASRVLASLLGYLDAQRVGRPGRDMLRMPSGQYLHCVGHSFGGRFLAQAIIDAANPVTATLPLLPRNRHHQFTVDNLLVFQMAARPDIFGHRLQQLLGRAPLQGPVCLTFSRRDHATCLLHRVAERRPGIGCIGAREPREKIKTLKLRPAASPYTTEELAAPIVNVDATWRFQRLRPPDGAHSDFGYQESCHLLLTLANFAR